MAISPIVIFCYNRPLHLKQTIAALKKNALASDSPLYVFSDASKGASDRDEVLRVRAYVAQISGFKRVEIVEAKANKGLSLSVIEGVNKVITSYGRVIVLEDDMITSTDFLTYMNHLLDVYEGRDDIFSVTGYAPPLAIPAHYTNDLYLAPRSSSWGWGTWKDRWERVDWGPSGFSKLKTDPVLKKRFLRGGNDLWPMIHKQQQGIIDSWAVRWCLAQAVERAYGVYPVRSKVRNIGTDGSGTNFTFRTEAHSVSLDSSRLQTDPTLQPDESVLAAFQKFYDLPLYLRIKNLLKYGIW